MRQFFSINHRTISLTQYFIPVILGVTFFLTVFDFNILNPQHIGWLLEGDRLQEYIGWKFFRQSAWQFPVLGASPLFGLEISNSIVFTDSNPLLALFFKTLSPWLPKDFQYFGIWLLFCCLAQAILSWKLLSLGSKSWFGRIAGTVLLLFIPAWAARYGHINLMGHFFLLWAIYLVMVTNRPRDWWKWIPFLPLSMFIHLYLTAMISIFWFCTMVTQWRMKNVTARWLLIYNVFPILVISFLSAWILGYFKISEGASAGGFGLFKTNILSPIQADGWSWIIGLRDSSGGAFEGFNYFGLGLLLLIICYYKEIVTWFAACRFTTPRNVALLSAITICWVYAISNQISLGPWTFSYPLPHFLEKPSNIFRASGRFFWPITYVIGVFVVTLVLRQRSRLSLVTVMMAAIIQVADTYSGWRSIHDYMHSTARRSWATTLQNPFWQQAMTRYQRLRWVPTQNVVPHWSLLAALAAQYGKGTDAVYLSRYDIPSYTKLFQQQIDALINGEYEMDTLYVIQSDLVPLISVRPGDVLQQIDNLWVLAPGMGPCKGCTPVNTSEQAKIIHFNNSLSRMLLGDGWSDSEPWGTWSNNHQSTLLLPRKLFKKENKEITIVIKYIAFLGGSTESQRIQVVVDDQTVVNTSTRRHDDNQLTFTLPHQKVFNDSSDNVIIHLSFPDAASPSAMGVSSDSRALAFGIVSLQIK